jgi:predicted nucleotidyltransferase
MAAYNRALVVLLHGVEVTVISLPDLIEMKRAAGRPQDQSDIEALLQLISEDPGANRG